MYTIHGNRTRNDLFKRGQTRALNESTVTNVRPFIDKSGYG